MSYHRMVKCSNVFSSSSHFPCQFQIIFESNVSKSLRWSKIIESISVLSCAIVGGIILEERSLEFFFLDLFLTQNLDYVILSLVSPQLSRFLEKIVLSFGA